jgi:penicillin amidase
VKLKKARKLKRVLLYLGIGILGISVLASCVLVYFVNKAQPRYNGNVSIKGLENSVEILRDKYGIPHIYASNEHDLFMAQGYVHAQDRLWQMEMYRRMGSGRLSEVLGESTLSVDKMFRIFGIRRIAEESEDKLDKDTLEILKAYAQGVNAFINEGNLPLEFVLLGYSPEPWTPVDSIAWGNMMAYNMGRNHQSELMWAEAISLLGPQKALDILGINSKENQIYFPKEINYSTFGTKLAQALSPSEISLPVETTWASNNWVVNGSKSDTGKPILANDTHLTLQMPSIWYENGLHGGKFNAVGFSFPGSPFVVIGHNEKIAWGNTNLEPDVQDLYIEKFDNTETPKNYEYKGKWLPLKTLDEIIKVRYKDPVNYKILMTNHGPIINDAYEINKEEPLSLKWHLSDGTKSMEALRKLNLAGNWNEFKNALKTWDTLNQHFIYADTEGNIGYQAAGKVPIRPQKHQGIVPMPGWTGEYDWLGYIPYEDMPSYLNPTDGKIATANTKLTDDHWPSPYSEEWENPDYRVKRISSLLDEKSKNSVDDMKKIQSDTYSLQAEGLIKYLTQISPESEAEAEAIKSLQSWDLRYESTSAPALMYDRFYENLIKETIGDEFKDAPGWFKMLIEEHITFRLAKNMEGWVKDNNTVVFDDVTTNETETRDIIFKRAFSRTIEELTTEYGKNITKWSLGEANKISFNHIPFGQSGVPLLQKIFNSDEIKPSGGRYTVNLFMMVREGESETKDGFGPPQRMIIDTGNWDSMQTINHTGQSGHMFSKNRNDQIHIWENNGYHDMPFTKSAVQKTAVDKLTLNP